MSFSEFPRSDRATVMPPEPDGTGSPMMDDPRVVEALEQYLAAVETGEKPNRQAFLARHAEIAGPLAECLDGLEALQAASTSELASAAVGAAGTSQEWQPEAPLGDFRIVREIGRGGMGIVYEAVQLSLGRRVALKVLPFAAALDAKQLQRFKNEAQAAAHLHHTNIVPVYAVGVERGVHFYAMQLIEGQNLAAVIADLRVQNADGQKTEDRHGEPQGPPATLDYQPEGPIRPAAIARLKSAMGQTLPNLPAQLSTQRSDGSPEFFRTVARLVVQVAEALDYAHGMGIIHRDVKPANLLVDGRGNVWITDFGLAQFHANAGVTQTGDLVGTLRYMSPEQAGGQRVLIDHRTDVYSLGATLYELLTLRPIFDGADRQALLRQIMHEEPSSPRSVDRSIPPELETIVLKAISKSPAERYTTAVELADDLHRFLRHEPIKARRATPFQRVRKWLRRHPSVLIVAALLLVLVATGSLCSAWLISGERDKTRQAYEREKEQFQIARQSVDELIKLAEDGLADKPHMEALRMQLLEAALSYYQRLIESRRDDPDAAPADLTTTRAHAQKILSDLLALQGARRQHLLDAPAVLDDLQLSTEQRERLKALSERLRRERMERLGEFHRLSAKEREQRLISEAQISDKALDEILSQKQRGRLEEIALQLQGPFAFHDPKVESVLQLTAEQKERIRAIEAETYLSQGGVCHDGPGPKPPGASDKPPKVPEQDLAKASERIQEILTADQLKRWRQMTGAPFRGPVSFPMPSFDGFGPRGGPGRHAPKGPRHD